MTGFSKDVTENIARDALGPVGIQVEHHGDNCMDVQVRPPRGVQCSAKWYRGALNVVDPQVLRFTLERGVFVVVPVSISHLGVGLARIGRGCLITSLIRLVNLTLRLGAPPLPS